MRVELFIGDGADRPQEAAARLLQRGPDVSVDLSPAMAQALGEGLGRFLLAGGAALRVLAPQTAALADALEQTVLQGRGETSDEAPYVMVVTGSDAPQPAAPAAVRTAVLTSLEREILARVSRGQTDGQIAAELFMSRRTVQNHLHRVREKTGMLTRADLIRWASTFAHAS